MVDPWPKTAQCADGQHTFCSHSTCSCSCHDGWVTQSDPTVSRQSTIINRADKIDIKLRNIMTDDDLELIAHYLDDIKKAATEEVASLDE